MESSPSASNRSSLRSWALGALAIVGGGVVLGGLMFAGAGVAAVGVSGTVSLITGDASACVSCHLMEGHGEAWRAGPHAQAAACTDCHLSPHPVGHWVTKADSAFFHVLAFTTGAYEEPLRVKPRNRRVIREACAACHPPSAHRELPGLDPEDRLRCEMCHRTTGHERSP